MAWVVAQGRYQSPRDGIKGFETRGLSENETRAWTGNRPLFKSFQGLGAGPQGASGLADCTQGEGMGWPLRMFQEEGFYFVTSRCFQGRLLLVPRGGGSVMAGDFSASFPLYSFPPRVVPARVAQIL